MKKAGERDNRSGGKSVEGFDSTVVRIETDGGLAGHGESCPLGPASLHFPAYAASVRAGPAELAPHLIGRDPTRPDPLNRLTDAAMKGRPYVKSPLEHRLPGCPRPTDFAVVAAKERAGLAARASGRVGEPRARRGWQ